LSNGVFVEPFHTLFCKNITNLAKIVGFDSGFCKEKFKKIKKNQKNLQKPLDEPFFRC